ncbi:MAG TPA: archease [Candidatus Nanoarchaeia archaeon]|nr:archease [Candidatus Nanoarchaeia archaeon]
MKYKFFEHTADALFEAYGKNLEELLTNAGLALEEIMVDLQSVKPTTQKKILIKGKNPEELVFNFLEELIFIKDTKLLLFNTFNIKVREKKQILTATILATGEKINQKKQKLGRDAKAITMHEFEVKKTKARWKARILVDI